MIKEVKRAASLIAVLAVFIASALSVSAAETDGIKASLAAESQTGGAKVTATVDNSNYYAVDGISYSIQVSDNAVITGSAEKKDVTVGAYGSDSLTIEVALAQTEPEDTTVPEDTSTPEDTTVPEDTTAPEDTTTPEDTSTPEDTTAPESTAAPETEAPSTTDTPSGSEGNNPQTGIAADGAAIAVCIAAAGVCVWAIAKKKTRILSLVLCAAIMGSAVTLSIPASADSSTLVYTGGEPLPTPEERDETTTLTETLDLDIDGENVTVTLTAVFDTLPEYHSNTEEDIQTLNGGNAVILKDEDTGAVTFINGSFTDKKINDVYDASMAIHTVASLLGFDTDTVSLIPYRNDLAINGDMYFTFAQTNELALVPDAYLKIGIDKDGNTICLSSSLDVTEGWKAPEDFIPEHFEQAYAAAEDFAESVGGEIVGGFDFPVICDNYEKELCYNFYIKKQEDFPLEKLDITCKTAEIFDTAPISELPTVENNAYPNDIYYDVTTEDMTFTDYFGNEVTLPVAKDEEGYYFIDPERSILCVDSDSMLDDTAYRIKEINPVHFDSAEDADPILVTVFNNMRTVYDSYKAEGILSIDGYGLPLLIGYGYPVNGQEADNACYLSTLNGFGCFLFGKTDISVALDTTAHEFAHGIRSYLGSAGAYLNNTGAIEEAHADVLGNLIQIQYAPESGETEKWYISEQSSAPIRCMSDPHMFCQPEYIGDVYYVMNSLCTEDTLADDHGGVHRNSSILGYVAWQMYQSGISIEDSLDIWEYMIFTLNPHSEFADAAEMIRLALERLGLSENTDEVNEILAKAHLEDSTVSWEGYERPEGAVKLTFTLKNAPEDSVWSGLVEIIVNGRVVPIKFTSDKNDTASGYILPTDLGFTGFWIESSDGQKVPLQYTGPITEDMTFDLDYNDIPAEAANALDVNISMTA